MKKKPKPTPDLNSIAADALAEKITRELMMTCTGHLCSRLVLEIGGVGDAGGMNYDCVRSIVARVLKGE